MDIKVGVHLIANVYDVEPCLLEKMDVGIPILEKIVQNLNLHVVYTYAFVLSESHFTIHTYPEHRSCYIDIFCCNKDFNSEDAITLLINAFGTTQITYQTIFR
jgi:S-adenosylmethionine decarboxylase